MLLVCRLDIRIISRRSTEVRQLTAFTDCLELSTRLENAASLPTVSALQLKRRGGGVPVPGTLGTRRTSGHETVTASLSSTAASVARLSTRNRGTSTRTAVPTRNRANGSVSRYRSSNPATRSRGEYRPQRGIGFPETAAVRPGLVGTTPLLRRGDSQLGTRDPKRRCRRCRPRWDSGGRWHYRGRGTALTGTRDRKVLSRRTRYPRTDING